MPELLLAWVATGDVLISASELADTPITTMRVRVIVFVVYLLFLLTMAVTILLVLHKRRERRRHDEIEDGSDDSSATREWRAQMIAAANDPDESELL